MLIFYRSKFNPTQILTGKPGFLTNEYQLTWIFQYIIIADVQYFFKIIHFFDKMITPKNDNRLLGAFLQKNGCYQCNGRTYIPGFRFSNYVFNRNLRQLISDDF